LIIASEVGETDDAVERCAQIVADAGQELGLQLIQFQQPPAFQLQTLVLGQQVDVGLEHIEGHWIVRVHDGGLALRPPDGRTEESTSRC
jgi:hypothetical protein